MSALALVFAVFLCLYKTCDFSIVVFLLMFTPMLLHASYMKALYTESVCRVVRNTCSSVLMQG